MSKKDDIRSYYKNWGGDSTDPDWSRQSANSRNGLGVKYEHPSFSFSLISFSPPNRILWACSSLNHQWRCFDDRYIATWRTRRNSTYAITLIGSFMYRAHRSTHSNRQFIFQRISKYIRCRLYKRAMKLYNYMKDKYCLIDRSMCWLCTS